MKTENVAYPIILVQLILAVLMWYYAVLAPNGYETIWAVMLFVELILLSILILMFIRTSEAFRK
ncbi:MAG: hypothetical protein M1402_04570 [Candidatus Thermoplasmatota archaeon]|nr:hypothetical protein [Candidatus Thermoplasmatota archaeon]MCL5666078.1 hypothetical protein [Candidatus Thermoplasmatota archaeon]